MFWIDEIKSSEEFEECKRIFYETGQKAVCKEEYGVWRTNIKTYLHIGEILGGEYFSFSEIASWFIKDVFNKYRQIYSMNADLYNSLKETKDIETIPFDVLNNLPYPSFWLDLHNCGICLDGTKIDGVLVKTDSAFIRDGIEFNIITLVYKDETGNYIVGEVPLRRDSDNNFSTYNLSETSAEFAVNNAVTVKALIRNTMQVLFYMCSMGCDVQKRYVPVKRDKKKSSKKSKPPVIHDIGVRVGEVISRTKIKYLHEDKTVSGNGKGTAKTPHFRRPHWHTYHTGKGRSETELRWVNLILVNEDKLNGGSVTPVVHKIK